MNIIILNGSPRKGNTLAACKAFAGAAGEKHQVEILNCSELNVSPCTGCGACQMKNGCVAKDDSNMVVDKIAAADMVVFASPVYWWNMTAQLKTVLDKCYCRGYSMKGKAVGFIFIGGAKAEDPQYKLLQDQFEYIAKRMSWDMKFFFGFSASNTADLANDEAAMAQIAEAAKAL